MSISNDDRKRANPFFDETERDGQEPTEEVGPAGAQVENEKCQLAPGDREGQPGACQIEHDEELYDAFPVEKIPIVMDETDGMPRPDDLNQELPLAHPFTYETVNCIEDARIYVEVFKEENEFARRFRYFDDGTEVERKTFQPSQVTRLHGRTVVLDENEYWLVRPIRERCKYYKRQVFAHDGIAKGDFGHFLVFRNCTMRRSVGGAFMSLMNEAVYACDYRDPPDPGSVEKYLDAKDRKKLDERPDLVLVPLFGVEGDEVVTEEK